MAKNKYYAVIRGKKTGIFDTWAECEQQIEGFSGAVYKSFKTRGEAESALGLTNQESLFPAEQTPDTKAVVWRKRKLAIIPADKMILDSISVDASCIGNPGDVEYRGVHTETREVFFHKRPMQNGTNNLGEFLAIVHALAYLKKQNSHLPIYYTDSETAIFWVMDRKVRTKLVADDSNHEIFELVERALSWLNNNSYENAIWKWNTQDWGEIPADFGRKKI
jgi:ribonuclease HI